VTPIIPVKVGETVTATASYSDPGDDTLTTTIYWGDGKTSSTTGYTITETHEYTTPGVYTVTLSVTDGSDTVETSYSYVVVYDPDGGFVTGGGWINSPEGAYVADPDLTGKANFGFVSKYKKGTTTPTGKTEFQFKAGSLNFHSTEYNWLVVAGAKAQFKGTGTINGQGSYKFMITAVDGALSNAGKDLFRIKIWEEDEVTKVETIIYDNMLGADNNAELSATTELGGGSIVIHKK
jgi:PKD repeat protein